MSTTAPDLFTSLRTGWADALQQWMDTSQSLWDDLAAAYTSAVPAPGRHGGQGDRARHGGPHAHHHRHGHVHRHGHGHGHGYAQRPDHRPGPDWRCDCDRDSTACCGDDCACCVPDADVVLHTRVGERRIVPLHLHNAWRRDHEITLGIGPWHVCSGDGLSVVAVLEEEKLTLQPCEDRVVRLVVGVTAHSDDTNEPNGPDPTDVEVDVDEGSHEIPGRGRLSRDVDRCASAYADVRFEGCARPLRVAVVVSPAACDAVDVDCDCGCC